MVVNGSVSNDDLERDDTTEKVDPETAVVRPERQLISSPGRRLQIVVAGVVLLVAIAVIVVLVTSRSPAKKSSASTSTTTPQVASGSTPFIDKQGGFSLSYPSSWTVTADSDPNVPLHLLIGPSGLDALLVRVVPLQQSVDTSNETNIKAYTDAVISGSNVNVLQQKAITINGLLGYYYFYSLAQSSTINATLVHSHFFLFPPHEMVSLTFQATSTDFNALASTFDQVIGSFRTS
jgi:hypothetical protein